MIRFKKLSIKNFLSYGEKITHMNLDKIGTTLIVGEDLDNTTAGMGANGCGKTVWINAFIYGIYGKPLADISMDNLVNNINKKNMLVEVEFEKDGKLITVRRARKETGAGNYAKVFVHDINTDLNEDIHDVTPASVNDINEYIVNILGIPYELFVRIVAFAATHTPFLSLPVRHASKTNQSDIMEELFRLTQLSSKADSIKLNIKDTKQSLEIKIKHNEQLTVEHERHEKQLTAAKKRLNDWENERAKEIKNIKNTMLNYDITVIDKQEELYNTINKLEVSLIPENEQRILVEKDIIDVSTKITILNAQLKTLKENKDKIIIWKNDNVSEISKIKIAADDLPKSSFLEVQKELNENKKSIETAIDELTIDHDEYNIKLQDVKSKIESINGELEHLEEAKCPYCLQQYEDASIKQKECYDDIDKLEKHKTKHVNYIEDVDVKITSENKKLTTLSKKIELSSNEILNVEQKITNCVTKMEELLNATCPHGNNEVFNEVLDAIGSITLDIDKNKPKMEEAATKLITIDDIILSIKNEITSCREDVTIGSLNEIYEMRNEIKLGEKNIRDLQDTINPYIEPLEEIDSIVLEPVDMDSVNELDRLLIHQNFLVKLLTKKDSFIRKNLLTKNLSFLNQRLAKYLSALGLPHKVEFTQEMTAKITQFGRELDFGNLSSGQKARVNLGLSFSFRDVLQKSHDSINVCMLDEVLDVGLDGVGVQNAARMLKHKAREEDLALYIISHRDEVSSIFDNRMVVQMEKGFSSVSAGG